jgi:hypothetical protein
MGVYSDILASALTIDLGGHDDLRIARDKTVVRSLRNLMTLQGDADYPSDTEATNEVQEIAEHSAGTDGGTFEITINLFGGVSFTTAPIAFDAVATTIESAIDTAADGVVVGYTAGDIAVTGGPLTTDPIVLTFSGDSVASKTHGLCTIDDSLLEGGGANEVQEIDVYNGAVTGGTFRIELPASFTTAPIAFDANAATIEAAIDAAATGVIVGWTNGDIAITGGPLTTTPVVLTFSGDSVAGIDWPQIVILDSVT